MKNHLQFLAAAGVLGLLLSASPLAAADDDHSIGFNMVVSAGAKACLPNATAMVKVRSAGPVDIMDVTVQGLPANTDFDFFVIQVPKAPFGVAWYQGDIVTDKNGRGHQQFVGRFNVETFAFAQGSAPAPVVFTDGVLPDASLNPAFNPIQQYHLRLWECGLPRAQHPFNGEHNAGLQVLNTSNFPDDHGPLRDTATSNPGSKTNGGRQ